MKFFISILISLAFAVLVSTQRLGAEFRYEFGRRGPLPPRGPPPPARLLLALDVLTQGRNNASEIQSQLNISSSELVQLENLAANIIRAESEYEVAVDRGNIGNIIESILQSRGGNNATLDISSNRMGSISASGSAESRLLQLLGNISASANGGLSSSGSSSVNLNLGSSGSANVNTNSDSSDSGDLNISSSSPDSGSVSLSTNSNSSASDSSSDSTSSNSESSSDSDANDTDANDTDANDTDADASDDDDSDEDDSDEDDSDGDDADGDETDEDDSDGDD